MTTVKILVDNKEIESIDLYDGNHRGHWIFQKIIHGKRMRCSNCDSFFDLCCNQVKRYDEATKREYLWNYCPWCGADMRPEPYKAESEDT